MPAEAPNDFQETEPWQILLNELELRHLLLCGCDCGGEWAETRQAELTTGRFRTRSACSRT